jgi:hypothetical protein
MDHQIIRDHLRKLLLEGQAHVDWKSAVGGLPEDKRGVRPAGSPHSPWELLEHVRIAQRDILEFSRNPNHVSPEWPSGYWPATPKPPSPEAWNHSLKSFEKDLHAMVELVLNPKADLAAPIQHGSGQTLLREALLVADHNAYHLGQFVLVRRLLGSWDET